MQSVKNQPLKWHGGKSYLAKWLHSLAPPSVVDDPASGYTHRNIVFAGGLGEFWNWECEGISETVNDMDGELTNFYAALRNTNSFEELIKVLEVTQLNEVTFAQCQEAAKDYALGIMPELMADKLSRAWWFFVRFRQSRQGLAKDYTTPTVRTRRGMNEQVSAWLSAVEGLPECHERLIRVEVRNTDCIKFIDKYDHERALFYCDPPYVHSTRSSKGEYRQHEMTGQQHADLIQCLRKIKGRFMLSGYHSELYDASAKAYGWKCHEKKIDNKASSAKTKEQKTECVWINY